MLTISIFPDEHEKQNFDMFDFKPNTEKNL